MTSTMASVLALACTFACSDMGDGRSNALDAAPVPQEAAMTTSPAPSQISAMEAAIHHLYAVAFSGSGDAEAEAKLSMDRGDFRFVGYSFMVPGSFPAAYGVQCEPSVWSQPALVGPMIAANDVPLNLEKDAADEANFRRFGAVYNATLLADPRFPHREMCSAVPVGDMRERPIEYRPAE
ncbi:MAG: hypothetical protein ACRED4_09630 [Brevundimonas sp.]